MNLVPLLLIAAAFWRQAPACGPVDVEMAQLPPQVVGLAQPALCRILLDFDPLGPAPAPGLPCMVVVHEYGHLLGYEHTADPGDVMYPVIPTQPRWPCLW